MALPINIDDLLHGHVVEWERIEFKEGWNDLDILHTICAFANDFRNLGGGYIVIGIEEREGRPVFPPKGLDPAQAGKIQSDLLNLCKKRIKDEYTPYVEPVTFQRKLILIIWCPGGMNRPYEVPDNFAKGAPRNYYIRKFNNTIKPNKEEKQELLRFAAIPFDDRINYQHTYKDLSRFWIGVFLQDIGSKLIEEFDGMPFLTICRQMNLVQGPDEFIRPKNFALLFFNLHPEKIFPMAQIEVVNFQTPTADSDFSEIYFKGPLQYQLKEVLGYFKTYLVKELVRKVSYQAQALRNFNFPYEALEEAVANAVYHKSYEIREPIEIRIHPDRIHIISYPGPDPTISMEDMETGKAIGRHYRNRIIGDYLKELKFTEGRSTGLSKIIKAMERNGSPKPTFESGVTRGSLIVTIPVHEAFLNNPGAAFYDSDATTGPSVVSEQVIPYLSNTKMDIIGSCYARPLSVTEITRKLGWSSKKGNLKEKLLQLIDAGDLEYTIPEKPDSRLQKYRITSDGYSWLRKEEKRQLLKLR